MKRINLRYVYPQIYKTNYYVLVTSEVYYVLTHNNYIESDYDDISILNEKRLAIEESFNDEKLIEIVHYYLKYLPLKQQNRIYERYFLNLKYVDIAKIEGCTEAAIRKSVNRGVSQLKKKILLYYFYKGW